MRCEDFLPWSETGNRMQRMRARRHARSCPGCAAALEMLGQLKQELAEAPPVPQRLRQKWLDAAASQTSTVQIAPHESRNARRVWLAMALAASLLLALIPLSKWRASNEAVVAVPPVRPVTPMQRPKETSTVSEIVVSSLDGQAELDQLNAEVGRLQDDLEQLIERSEQLAARQQLSQLLASHQKWQATGM
jgi:hypothetical protein